MAASAFVSLMSADEIAEALKQADSEVLHVWEQAKVPVEAQAVMVNLGFTDAEVFANLQDLPEKRWELLAKELRYKHGMILQGREMVGRIVGAWKAAQVRGDKAEGRRSRAKGPRRAENAWNIGSHQSHQ